MVRRRGGFFVRGTLRPMRKYGPVLALCFSLTACVSWPSFKALARDADRAFSDATAAIEQCQAVAEDEQELAACVSGVILALQSAGRAGDAVAREVCEELETRGVAQCGDLSRD